MDAKNSSYFDTRLNVDGNSLIHKPQRKSIRLADYDYSQEGAYYITFCTEHHPCLFGQIVDDTMHLNRWGKIVEEEWLRSEIIRKEIELAEYVIMPNHFHAIVLIRPDGRTDRPVAYDLNMPSAGHPNGPKPGSIGALLAGFKSAVTKRVNMERKTPGAEIWQRNYWEHVIRNEKSYEYIANYIVNNPQNWIKDQLYSK